MNTPANTISMNPRKLHRRALHLGFASLTEPAGHMSPQDILNIANDDGPAKLRSLFSTNEPACTPESGPSVAPGEGAVASASVASFDPFTPFEDAEIHD